MENRYDWDTESIVKTVKLSPGFLLIHKGLQFQIFLIDEKLMVDCLN